MVDRRLEVIRKRFDAVVFDLDGTLVDTAPGILAYLNEMLAELDRPALELETVRPMIGNGVRSLMIDGLEASGGLPDGVDIDRLFGRYLERYSVDPARASEPYPGVVETLETLAEGALSMGVCTNKPQIPTERLLAKLDLDRYFRASIGGDALPIKKPDPGHLLTVLERLDVDPARAAFIGDSPTDAKTAKAANIPCVLVSFGYTPTPVEDLGADHVIDDFSDLIGALADLAVSSGVHAGANENPAISA